jgi:glycosyltransferase involved in cell wall biosynthesis
MEGGCAMRITFVLPHADLSGGVRVAAIYAQGLLRRGHEVVVISTPRHTPSLTDSVRSFLRGRGWPRQASPESSHFDDVEVPHRILECFRPVTDRDVPDADVVVATWWKTAYWVAALDARKGGKAYFIQHDERVMIPPSDPAGTTQVKATWSLPLEKIAVAQWLVDLVRPYAGGGRVWLVGNGVDAGQFHAPPRGKQTTPTVGMLYSRSAYKGCADMLQAFQAARQRVPGLRLVAFGTQSPVTGESFPPDADFHLCPDQRLLAELYARCDAWLFGSRCEGFGLPILEAMACRTPVIGTPAGAAPELLAGGGGILIDPGAPAGMADAIARVAQMSETQWRGMSDAAYRTASGCNWESATDCFEKALLAVAQRSRVDRNTPVSVGT